LRKSRLALFNSMTQRKEPYKVVEGETVRLFVCGPTVQSYIHVGHARTYVFYDVLSRYLAHLGLRVEFLVNITDVDDRITEAARGEGTTTGKIVEKYTKEFLKDLRGLEVRSVTKFEPVSKYLQVMIDQISILMGKGRAYLADGVVYFDTSKYPEYGKLSHQTRDELSLRPLELTPNKRSLPDFSLWRPVVLEKGKWESPWGRGSPGWHIEDTAVTLTNFGPQYDIHGGAYELIYPHHEAELAQGESLTEISPLERYWVHTGLVNLSGRKMSKSAGNTFLVKDLLREFDANELRFYLLSWHYREDVEFLLSGLRTAAKKYARLVGGARKFKRGSSARAPAEEVHNLLRGFYEAMDDDMDTPRAIRCVERLIREGPSNPAGYSALGVASKVLGVDFVGS